MSKTTSIEESDLDEAMIARFECQLCETSYVDELFTRVHITRSDDEVHKNHDGFMPETEINAVDTDGKQVGRLSRRPEELNTVELERRDLPDEFGVRKQRVLLIAAYRPQADYAEVHKRATDVFTESGLEQVSYGTVRRWLRAFYEPQSVAADESEHAATASLTELTHKQQAVVLARVRDLEASYRQLAERAGCSVAYPSSVLEQYEGLIETLSARLEGSQTVSEIAESELPENDLHRLAEDDLLGSDFFGEAIDSTETNDESDHGQLDRPVTGSSARIMTASPTDVSATETGSAGSAGAKSENDQNGPSGSLGVDANADSTQADSEANGLDVTEKEPARTPSALPPGKEVQDGMIPVADIEKVRDRLRFLRRVAEQELESGANERARTQLALAREVETELDQVLMD